MSGLLSFYVMAMTLRRAMLKRMWYCFRINGDINHLKITGTVTGHASHGDKRSGIPDGHDI